MVKDTSWKRALVTAMEHANPGDLIEFLDPVFRHWAVYADDNDGEPMIVHFYQWDNKGYKVQYDSIVDVAAGRQCHVHNKYDNRHESCSGYNKYDSRVSPYDADTIMRRALQCVKESENGTYREFDLYTWNSEHFASWCRNGVAYSDQTTGRNLLYPENYWWGLAAAVRKMKNVQKLILQSAIPRELKEFIKTNVTITNKSGRRALVRIDSSRSHLNSISAGIHRGPLDSVSLSRNYSSSFDAFYIVDTSISFSTIEVDSEITFHPAGKTREFAFLTVWLENDEESWTVWCEDHSITKRSMVLLDSNVIIKPMHRKLFEGERLLNEHIYIREGGPFEECLVGRIVVYNKSSKNIWVRVNADGIEQTNHSQTSKFAVGVTKLESKYIIKRKVYYRAKQGKGYTLVKNTGNEWNFTTFHLDVPNRESNGIFYLSIDYETKSGELAKSCIYHSQHFLSVRDPKIPTAYTPHVFVEDDGESIKWNCQYYTGN